MKNSRQSLLLATLLIAATLAAPPANAQQFTRADTLRGSITPQRAWWEVTFYDLQTTIHSQDSTIEGQNTIYYRVIDTPQKMQIDLQSPMRITQITRRKTPLSFQRFDDTNAYFIDMPEGLKRDSIYQLTVQFEGKPKVAVNPPWDGGFIWRQDSLGNPWIATANQGLGASVWWPNKDHQTAEPDSMRISITTPDSLVNVSNGRLQNMSYSLDGTITWNWMVTNPINNYSVTVNTGNYKHFEETFEGKTERSIWTTGYLQIMSIKPKYNSNRLNP